MSAKSIAEQRTVIYDTLVNCQIGNVEKYSRADPIPPVTVINGPRIDFPDNSFVGIAEWAIWLMGTRTAPAAALETLDESLTKVLLAFSHGVGIGVVIQRVENVVRTSEGVPLPGFTITIAAAVPNC